MTSTEMLKPAVKMKVDELFLTWLSDPATLSALYDRLDSIKSGHKTDLIYGTTKDKSALTRPENNKVAPRKKREERMSRCPLNENKTDFVNGGTNDKTFLASHENDDVASRKNQSQKKSHSCGSALPSATKFRSSGGSSVKPVGCISQASLRKKASPSVPRFYFPGGRPEAKSNTNSLISNIKKTFSQLPLERATVDDMGQISKDCQCPLYWKGPLFFAAGGKSMGFVTAHDFVTMWEKTQETCQDDASKFVHLLAKPECNYLEQEDFVPFVQDVVRTHPSLSHLEEDPNNKSKYITTVIQRIFYNVNRTWSGKITCLELRKSNFLQSVAHLEDVDDTSELKEFFSYDHFFVICYKFSELDTDLDNFIDQQDLAQHSNQAISHMIIERIFSGAVTRGQEVLKEGKMSYADFVWFLISEEDKRTNTSIEYWFRCMDLDGDGVLSMYELEHLYEGQCQTLVNSNFEPRPFEDLICELLDLVQPEVEGKITLRDLKRCKMTHVFFDTFINVYKYLDREQTDPYYRGSDKTVTELSDWEKYIEMEFEVLLATQAEDNDDWMDEQQQQSSVDELVSAVKKL